ncbi:MAG: hypothetical protein HFG44_00030 [Oscillospiraceae bacterium]|nr:hypothetical protein [Oscillospiraceae bacterium]
MNLVISIAQFLLIFWFFGCICTYKLGKYILVEGVGIKSPEFVMFCLFGIGIILFWQFPLVGEWWIFVVLVAWLIIQFFCHWYYTLFGASEKKLKGYNECFQNTVHIIPASEEKLIPDLYHIILHLLILLNLVFATFAIVK